MLAPFRAFAFFRSWFFASQLAPVQLVNIQL
jgi:hypothetical protein